jgi:hypothetical protein
MSTRRTFIFKTLPASAALLGGAHAAFAQAQQLAESDPAAAGLGYKQDATKVDAKKFPAYVAGHHCGNCQLFQGKPGDASGGCGVFAGKVVSAKGWCSAWTKKA